MGGNACGLNERGPRAGQILRRHIHLELLCGGIKHQRLALALACLERYPRVAYLSAAQKCIEACQRFVHYTGFSLEALKSNFSGVATRSRRVGCSMKVMRS